MNLKTIVATATPLGTGAISIIKMSGSDCLKIAQCFFVGPNYEKIVPRNMYFGKLNTPEFVEECLMVYFRAPFSYTGEDVVEFQIHGSELLVGKIIDECQKFGAVLAEPGEFTKRAFLNGKISLDKAEGVIDVINAESEAELKSANSLFSSALHKQIKTFQNELTDILAKLEVDIDYPENETAQEAIELTKNKISLQKQELEKIYNNSKNGEMIKSGVNVALVGKPNAGKSSLLNALLQKERAIVTNIPGTTRDTICETIIYKNVKFNLTDTAGLRNTDNEIEVKGINKSLDEIEKADVVLYLVDESQPFSEQEKSEIKNLKNPNLILVGNKIDKKHEKNNFFAFFNDILADFVEISAKENKNLEKLKELIYKKTALGGIDFSQIVLTNKRHLALVKEALSVCDEIESCNFGSDIFAYEVKKLWNTLGKITGETENEDIINTIFSKFCLGK